METPRACAACGAEAPAGALSCPKCGALVHTETLQLLAQQAKAAESDGRREAARDLWQQALALLPQDSRQYETIRGHVEELARQDAAAGISEQTGDKKPGSRAPKALGAATGLALLVWKFKAVALVLLTKAKFLFLGLGKLKTLLSMLVFLGVYWNWFGLKFAVPFVLAIYVHEMGHVWALRRFGLRASAPMFVPGFGAFVSLYQSPANVSQDARIGLAGPVWGLGAAAACWAAGVAASQPVLLAVAHATALLNAFNLIPIWQLDGGRGLRALNRPQRTHLLALTGLVWLLTHQGIFFLILLGLCYRLFWQKDHAPEADRGAEFEFAALLVAFGLFCLIQVKGPA